MQSLTAKETLKTRNFYQVRYYPSDNAASRQVGFKHQYRRYESALKIKKRLRKAGIDAFTVKVSANGLTDKQYRNHK
jgi:hypothetical protein